MAINRRTSKERSLTKSIQEYMRGIAGGLLFSLPLLYTMEVWWAGFTIPPLRLLIYILATYTLLLGYNRYGGLRRDASPAEVAIDSIEEMGLGIVTAAVVLWLLGQVKAEMTGVEIGGKIIVEAMTAAIGVSVGTAQLGGGEGNQQDDRGMAGEAPQPGSSPTPFVSTEGENFSGQIALAACGAVVFAANLAPTDEIVMIATQASSARLLGFAVISMLFGGLILFYSDFTGSERFTTTNHGIKTVIFGTIITYAIALVASAAMLWFFGRFDGTAIITCLSQTVVLGLAATLGASAGRLLIQ